MQLRFSHPWVVDSRQGAAIQRELAEAVRLERACGPVSHIAGIDCGFRNGGTRVCAAVTRFTWPGLEFVESHRVYRPVEMPYRPGLLSFRELPAVLDALAGLSEPADLILCDGQGIAHPRRLGIAAHLGVLLDRPALGVAKSRLVGEHAPVGERRGAAAPLYAGEERIGTVLRTRDRVRPVYVSPGHRLDCATAAEWALACCTRYRLPEPIRKADHLAAKASDPVMQEQS